MDCKDLMVKDLVYVVRGYDKHLTIEKIKGVIADENEPYPVTIFTGETVSLNNIKPIPLTEDILVKNGFVGVELIDSYELNTDYYEIEVWNYSDGLWVVNVQWIEFSSTPESQATVSFVHQLQHLLRLCGLKKEIEL